MNKLMKCLEKQKQILETQGYSIALIVLYGSQNYNLDTHTDEYQSDIDMKAIIVPTLDDLVENSKPISTVIDTEWGQCDLKDIRPYFQTLLKANPAYVETLFTDYYIVDDKFKSEFDEVFSMREELVETLSAQFIRAMYGMMCEKQKALCHPYPTIKHKIDKFGYDGKQAHHVLRLWYMMNDYFGYGISLSECFYPKENVVDILMDYKLNKPPLNDALAVVKEVMAEAQLFKNEILESIDESKIDYSIKDKFLSLSQSIIKNKIIEECRVGGDI